MENKAHALVAGLFTLLLLIAAILIALWFNRDKVGRVPYEMVTKHPVLGLNPQAAVRYRGLDVGRVEAIHFDPKVPGQIVVLLDVRPDTPITKSTYGSLAYQGVTGLAYVQLDDDGSKPETLRSSADDVARIEMRESLLDKLQERGLAILDKTEQLTERFNTLLSPANQQAAMTAIDSVSRAAGKIERVPDKLQPTLDKLPALTNQAAQTMASFKKLSDDARTLTDNLNRLTSKLQAPEGAVARITNAADQVSSVADNLQDQALPLTHDMQSSLRSLNRTLEHVDSRPQSLLFGTDHAPGPGEPGFTTPAKP
jgi:phospholipid/cholesterol/gamma-HCH transport system substrate-binding protein